jgi:magnesium transporter
MKKGIKSKAEEALGKAVSAANEVTGAVGSLGRKVRSNLSLPGLQRNKENAVASQPGMSPGIESMTGIEAPPAVGTVQIQCTDYGAGRAEVREVTDLVAFLKEPRPEWASIRWLNVHGLHPYIVNQIRGTYPFHTLAAEDVLRVPQRPKLETFDDNLFIVARMLMLQDGALASEQVSFFLFKGLVITFQERTGDIWDPIRQRIQKPTSRFHQNDASYLLYALLDAVVDHCFPILEKYGEMLEELEHEVAENPTPQVQRRVHGIKRELSLLRRVIWPMREVMNELHREETEEVSTVVKAYMRDVYDHAVQVMDIVETCRETASGLNDLYMSAVSNRMNEVMKVLTIMASFFIPITFVAGVYGMNFEFIPELHWKYSYVGFWAICLSITLALAVFFYRKGWIGRR